MLKNTVTMKVYSGVLIFALIATTFSSAIPKTGEGKTRVVDKDLSGEKHFDGEDHEHNAEYDHEAFLGKDEAKTFDQLTPEESKEKLGKIYDKIDKDGDGQVSEEELKEWIRVVQKHYVYSDTDRQWKEHEPEGDTVTWESYKKRTYGFLDDEENPDDGDTEGYNYKDMIRRDERRWKKADKDGDNKLTKEEFADFLHPEEADHMRDIVVDETLEDIDKDKDGFISLEEYIGDMYSEQDKQGEEPEWVKSEREVFNSDRDANKDGKMDRDEIKKWIIPTDYDHVESEAKHLIGESDVNKDGTLTKAEVLDKYDLFVGSQATDFGEALTRHEEF